MANHSPPERARITGFPFAWPVIIPPSGTCDIGTPAVRSGPESSGSLAMESLPNRLELTCPVMHYTHIARQGGRLPESRPLSIPVVLGTNRKGRMSSHAARFVAQQLEKREDV